MVQLRSGNYLGFNRQSFSVFGVIVSETYYDVPVFEGWHTHENPHITFTLLGGNREERKQQASPVTAGQIVIYNSGEAHRNYATQHPSKNINLEIQQTFFTLYDLHPQCFEQNYCSADAKFTMLKIFQECKRGDTHSALSAHTLLLRLLCPIKTKAHTTAKWVVQLKALLHDEWNEAHTLKDLASSVGIHPVTLSRSFAYYFGCNLGDYIRKIRIDKPIELMCATNFSLTQIAHCSGFYDQSHFIRTFRDCIGMSPKMLKKLQR